MTDWADLEIQGLERELALRDIAATLSGWGLAMPPGKPMPFHFGLEDFRTIGETEFWVANEPEHGYCGKFLFVFENQRCPYHRHQVKHETFFVVRGNLLMQVGEEERLMRPGDVLVMPPGVGHSFVGAGGPALVLEVSMPSVPGDSFFADKRIGDEGVT